MDKRFNLYYFLRRILWRISLAILLFFSVSCFAQQPSVQPSETLPLEQTEEEGDTILHSPRKAAIYSAILPGLGQIYNRKYWKLPIVYAGFGTIGYFIGYNNTRFQDFKQAYKDFPDYKLDYAYPLTLEQIDRAMIYYKRWRDLSILGTLGFYLFQIIDATVDAHLINWEVGDDLTFNLEPALLFPPVSTGINTFGLRACLSF